MVDVKKLGWRNRFALEILGLVALAEFALMVVLAQWAPAMGAVLTNTLDILGLMLICAPLIFWRCRAVHDRAQLLGQTHLADLTARKTAQAALERQTRLLAEVVESAPYGLAVYDEHQVLRLHNAQFAGILDLPAAMLAQQPFHFYDQVRYQHARGDYGCERSLEAVLAGFQDAMASRTYLTTERRQFDGRHVVLRAYPISDGWTVLHYRDNTEREKQRLHLIDAQERARMATESAGIGIWSLNTITGEQVWDAQQYRLFGLVRETHLEAPIYDLWSGHLHPEDAEASRKAFQQTINHGMPFAHAFRIIRPDGALRHIKALGSPRLDAQGRVDYIVGTNMDVTEATLLAQAMQDARALAEEASRVKSQFLANMSHEIRTPMNAVVGMLTLLDRSDLDAPQRNYLAKAQGASRVMLDLFDDILDHAKLGSVTVVLALARFRLDEMLQLVSALVTVNLADKAIDVRFDVDPRVPDVLFGDRQRLQQILVNLMGNAIKFTRAGEVVCTIQLPEQHAAAQRVAFCIRDTGIGIAPDFQEAIFRSFTQVQSSATREFGGVGLGLPISQRLVELMGGSIHVESEVGVGSSFSFAIDLLPAYGEATPPPGPTPAEPALLLPERRAQDPSVAPLPVRPRRLQGLHVLAVDDVVLNQTVIEDLLKSEGAAVTLAANGRQAVDAVLSTPATKAFDVVLMDIQMPVMDGYEATRLIRSLPQGATLPIIAVTANTLPAHRALSLAAGMNHHVGKPYHLDELVALMCSAIATGQGAAAAAAIVLPQRQTEPVEAPLRLTRPMLAYWIHATPGQPVPDASALMQQGVVLQLLESVAALEALLSAGAPAGLLVLDLATATSAPVRALNQGAYAASMHAMPMIALADAATEVQMRACLEAGAVDVVPVQFACHGLPLIAARHLNSQGQRPVGKDTEFAAQDIRRAIDNMQADLPFFASLLREFFDEMPARMQHLHEDWLQQPQQAGHHGHALKGLAMTFGLLALADVAKRIENQAAQGDALDAALLAQAEGEMQSAGFQILRWLQRHEDESGGLE
jgi:PAS domain S-box-containing protein